MSTRAPFPLDCRLTGFFYLGLAAAGLFGFLLIRPALFVEGDPAATLANLVARPDLARAGVAFELALVAFQALASVWFYKLFRGTDTFAAGTLAVFGTINAIVVLCSAACLATALESAALPGGVSPGVSHLMYLLSGNFWRVGSLFFGLWLVPMGWLTPRSGLGPRALGWVLIVGGIGYVVGAFLPWVAPDVGPVAAALPGIATIGEFWMIGLLLWRGFRGARD